MQETIALQQQASRDLILDHTLETIQFLIDLMHGQIKDSDGNWSPLEDIELRLQAARDILDLAVKLSLLPANQPPSKAVKVVIERDAWDDLLAGIAQGTQNYASA